MRRSIRLLAMCAVPALALLAAGERSASACGGCFGPPKETDDVVTDHRMVLSVSPQQTTLYDQIRYAGNPSSFAWVLPIRGTVTIGISSNAIFDALDASSRTTVQQPPSKCPAPPQSCGQFAPGTANAAGGGSSSGGGGGVSVSNEQVVGPYETVQLHSTDPAALDNWMNANGYAIGTDLAPVVAAYVQQGFDFLAMKLVPGQGVQSMRPVRVSFGGASPTLPLRMVAAGTGATVGITLWVVADGRWEPSNFPWFHVDDADIVWDWSKSDSNYATLRAQKETDGNNAVWEVESSVDLSPQGISTSVTDVAKYGYLPGQGGFGGGSSGGGVSSGGDAYEAIPATSTTPGETPDQVMQDDLTALFAGISGPSFRLTRLRADLAHASLASDLQLQAASDQSALPNLRVPAQSINETCAVYSGCNIVGYEPVDQLTGSSSHGSFGCAVNGEMTSGLDLAALAGALGMLGLGAARARRRR
ncbi:MAG TPA: DUF2330 domain-containing protein [Polyangiaceae bacterium]